MPTVRTIDELEPWRGGSFVPTMVLHEGHLALIRRAARCARPVVVSVFVNPTQFGPGEDFGRYPRDLGADATAAEAHGAEAVFAPDVEMVYPPSGDVETPELPEVAVEPGLEDAQRPGHLAGVSQVVARLFDLVRPVRAVFGEKDYQQLLVIRAMARRESARWPGLEIVPHETIREPDGLALSSRNAYLGPEERERACGLVRALERAGTADGIERAESLMRETLEAHGLAADYAVVRDAETLLPPASPDRPLRGLIAARLGTVRLIDNMPVTLRSA